MKKLIPEVKRSSKIDELDDKQQDSEKRLLAIESKLDNIADVLGKLVEKEGASK